MSTLNRFIRLVAVGVAACLGLGATVTVASPIDATYFAISSSDPSYNTMCCSTTGGEVLNTLGPDGLPLYNPAYAGPAIHAADLHPTGAGSEITWWSPSLNPHVTQIAAGTTSLPINQTGNFFPCVVNSGYACNDAQYALAAHYSGRIDVATAEPIQFSIGADDSAFVYIDGMLACEVSGVHPYAPESCTTPTTIGAGSHGFDLFFADLNQVQSGLKFAINSAGVTTEVPEPSSLALLAFATLGAFAARRRSA